MGKRAIAATAVLVTVLSVGSQVSQPAITGAHAASPLCGSLAGATPHITKVLWIFMENTTYGTQSWQVPGNPSAAYIDGTLMAQCGSTSDYHAVSHPSYPNYIAATSGSTQGTANDTLKYFAVPSIFSQADPSWRSYEEFMPAACDHVGQTGSPSTLQYYVGRHNPAASYSALPVGAPKAGDCPAYDEALGTATSGALAQDVSSGTLPAFSFVTPGLCNDMHVLPSGVTGCPNPTQAGDNWLAQWIPKITSGPDYTSGNLVIDIAWDEGQGGAAGADCTTSAAPNCIVPNIVISPYTTHVVSGTHFSHYSLLKTTETLLGLPYLGHAADASTNDMCLPFGLCPQQAPPPTASFTAACSQLSCTFDGSSSSDPGGTITSYAWDFGDGGTGSGVTASHAYTTAGTYPVTLTVTNAQGLTGSSTQQVTVTQAGPAPISFVASAATTGNWTKETVTVPASVATGDGMVLLATGASSAALTGPPGWSLVGTASNTAGALTTTAWSRVAAQGDAGQPVSVGFAGVYHGSVQLLAYSGTSSTAPVATFGVATNQGTTSTATTPTVTVPGAGYWLLSYWASRSSTVNSWTAPAGLVVRSTAFGTGGGRITSLAADGGTPAAQGPAGGFTASTDQPFGSDGTWTIVLAPGP